eukprot:Opistho-2@64355
MAASKTVLNFSAGPAKLPRAVLERARDELLDYAGSGMSVMELSHRSKEFEGIIARAEQRVRSLLHVPSNYKVLFLQGGGSTQFSAVPLNLIGKEGAPADYVVTGHWSSLAAKEAQKYATVRYVLSGNGKKVASIPPTSEWALSPDASYVYYCANETIDGVEFNFIPETGAIPLVCDMSSNIMSRPIDVTKFGLIYAGAQKNMGPSGVTLVIVREDLLAKALPSTPLMLNYKLMADTKSLYNTPPTYSIYIAGLVFDWIHEQGGVEAMDLLSAKKAGLIYGAMDASDGFYSCPIASGCRSRMNLPFRIRGGNTDLEDRFIVGADAKGLLQLRGHRSVGGIRASLYNAVSVEETATLAEFMREFAAANK